MIFTVLIPETIERLVEVDIEAPTEDIAKSRALELYQESPESAILLSETRHVNPEAMEVIRVDDN